MLDFLGSQTFGNIGVWLLAFAVIFLAITMILLSRGDNN